MYPKSVFLLIALVLTSFFGFGQKSIIQKYIDIANRYNVNPPALNFGYPYWYRPDSTEVSAVIYLKDDLNELAKLSENVYVSSMDPHNAEIIRASHYGSVYAIVPDESVNFYESKAYLDVLRGNDIKMIFYLVGSGMKFAQFNAVSWSGGCVEPVDIRTRDIFDIRINNRDDCLIEGHIQNLDSLPATVRSFYLDNYFEEVNYEAIFRREIGSEYCKRKIDDLKDLAQRDDNIHLRIELNKWKEHLSLVEEHGRLRIPSIFSLIDLDLMGNTRTMNSVYQIIDRINKGVYQARNSNCRKRFKKSYQELYLLNKVSELKVVHLEFPDLLSLMEEIYEMPPPPLVE